MYRGDELKINQDKTKGNILGLTFKNKRVEENLIQKVEPTYFKENKSGIIDTLEYLFKYS